MISRNKRINAFVELGKYLTNPKNKAEIEDLAISANRRNNWFTVPNVLKSLNAIGSQYLEMHKLTHWANTYEQNENPKSVGVIMAGNLPAVGFHDALAVLVSGHTLLAKLSTEDMILIPALLEKLVSIEPGFAEQIKYADRLNDADSFIATGSDNTARYFHYYFSKKPNIIRRNRTSVAILTGRETSEELYALGLDMLQYFGLGCRNVSKLFVPVGYDFTKFYESIQSLDHIFLNHHKYFNNYEYNKSVLLINRTLHYDNGFLMITENPAFVSPISTVYYETYDSVNQVQEQLEQHREKIQCVIGRSENISGAIPFGSAQEPGLSDYADSVDTMTFLSTI